MGDNWIKAFQSTEMIRAEIAREKLEEHGIPAVILNIKDSILYPFSGKYEVRVPAHDLLKAQTIISDEATFEQPE
ncbi:hypothetical protein DYBT9275_03651 [Dyadobacter sp. CECT 9275]|uniref:DUF2007 domain-containing protein n=2 Tax=Dyadobacter helix TaxID=2822344 RepID=A0A916JI26_9BACT|nr:hypothetical protein DYBT9275_03651 [Dyadobacter sp. CECT 9275]